MRTVDRTIVEVAAANDGRYSVNAYLRHDPAAQQAFAETHARRLEAMRKVMRSVERAPDGTLVISPDYLAKVEAFEKRQLRSQAVDVEILSAEPIEKLPAIDAATWIDRELISDAPTPLRDAEFGQLSVELGKPFKDAMSGVRIEGRLVRTVEMASGRHALVERSRD